MGKMSKICLYGFGNNGKTILKHLKDNAMLHCISAICDKNIRYEKSIAGIPVYTLQKAVDEEMIFFVTPSNLNFLQDIHRQMESVGAIFYDTESYESVIKTIHSLGISATQLDLKKKPTIRINYISFWNGWDNNNNFIMSVLKEKYTVELSENPDVVFSSVFGNWSEVLKYDCVRVLVTGEPYNTDFNIYDFAIGFDYCTMRGINNGKPINRYLRYPLAIWNETVNPNWALGWTKEEADRILATKTKFCNFIYGHESAYGNREKLFDAVMGYKRVESVGPYRYNMTNGETVALGLEKIAFLSKYKFTIASESVQIPGFVTEKLTDAFKGGSIPIYYGDPFLLSEYNEEAIIYWSGDETELEGVVKRIKQVDEDDELFAWMLMQPKFKEKEYIEEKYEEFESFLYNIFDGWKPSHQRVMVYRPYDLNAYLKRKMYD